MTKVVSSILVPQDLVGYCMVLSTVQMVLVIQYCLCYNGWM